MRINRYLSIQDISKALPQGKYRADDTHSINFFFYIKNEKYMVHWFMPKQKRTWTASVFKLENGKWNYGDGGFRYLKVNPVKDRIFFQKEPKWKLRQLWGM